MLDRSKNPRQKHLDIHVIRKGRVLRKTKCKSKAGAMRNFHISTWESSTTCCRQLPCQPWNLGMLELCATSNHCTVVQSSCATLSHLQLLGEKQKQRTGGKLRRFVFVKSKSSVMRNLGISKWESNRMFNGRTTGCGQLPCLPCNLGILESWSCGQLQSIVQLHN